jgi:NAD(P)-dependent dehydrogenase (short-subunit alcohol dehydrogenase family)
MDHRSFDRKVAVITGAARGLGRALAIRLADLGAQPVLVGRDRARLATTAQILRERTGHEPDIEAVDLADAQAVARAAAAIAARHPRVDLLINNAAAWLPGPIEKATAAAAAEAIGSAVTGAYLMTAGLLPALRRSPAADVVMIVSRNGLPGERLGAASAAFHAGKHGQSGLAEALRQELAPDGIRVTAIYPPEFDDVSPLDPAWESLPDAGGRLTNRQVVDTVLFALAMPRACSVDSVVLANLATARRP